MIKEKRLEKLEAKLSANIAEAKRQMEFAGERLGVFDRLRELDRERAKIERKILELENDH